MLHSTKQWQVLSTLQGLSGTNERLVSTTTSNFQCTRRTTLKILGKLDSAHIMRIRGLQDRTKRDRIISLQLGQLSSKLEELKEISERSATEHRILESLRYQRMEARQEKIIDAHAQTFEWIFDSSNRLSHEENFIEWLTNGNDIFWVTGKAGSGKSTLMKFLSNHKSSTSALQRWADEKELITATFYFWHAGTELQRSQEGLLQSLLHGVLSQCPEIMPQVLSKRWELCSRPQYTQSHWTRAELLDAFAQLSNQDTLKKRFCFFIDGLDEYDGDHSEVVDLVQGFARSKDIKVCLSSRPWNVFTRAFGLGSHPNFHLEDLTQQDIKSYVQDTLGGNKLFCQLAEGKDSARCRELEDSIVCRAQGVFLWVFLVVRSLMEGLTNADRITDLERRLQSLPTDLEAYFRHMLENIEEFYVQQTVQTFHIALQAVEPLSLMTYAMMDELEDNPKYAIELPVRQMTNTEIESRCQDMKLRINARCKDLLQITRKKVQKVREVDSVNTVNLSRSEALPLSKSNALSETLLLESNFTDDSSYTVSPFKQAYVTNVSDIRIETDETSNCEQSLHPLEPNSIDGGPDTFFLFGDQALATNVSDIQNIETDETSKCEHSLHPSEPNSIDDDSDTCFPSDDQALATNVSQSQNTESDETSNCELSLHPFFEYEVEFLHRTVKDFFQVSDVQGFIASRIPETFNSCALLCHAFLAQIKVAPIELHHFNQPGELSDLVDDLAHYAHQVETQTASPIIELLDELSEVIRVHRNSLRKQRSDGSMTEPVLIDPSMSRLCQSFLGFAVQRDLRLYVTHKLDERLRRGSATSEFDELVLDALEPSVTSKYGAPSSNLTLLRLLVDRGVDLNRTLSPLSVWDQIIGRISSQWAHSTNDTRVYQLGLVITLLEVGADPNWSRWQDRLGWVKFVLIPFENWRTRSVGFETALTRTIVALCERGIDPYWEFEGHTLWYHIIRSICDGAQTSAPLSLETTELVLVIIKRFMGLGAQLDDMVYQNVDKYEQGYFVGLESLSVTDVLTRILTKKQLEELELLQGRAVQKSSKAKASGAQRRRKKKRRREERRKILGH